MRCWLAFIAVLVAIWVAPSLAEDGRVFVNPVASLSRETEGAWEDYGFGDPFVARYNGTYYLYPSVRDDQVGIRCWSSRDLVSWKYEGYCATDPTTKGAYAPEVYRGNDGFYMTTSPAGRGHFIYRSESPTGPFERVTENFGLSIDGSVFVDDDGSGYFYSASDRGILAYRMKSPSSVDPSPIETGSFMFGWTEGPTVFKSDGIYYTTYTGNHVFSRGYRINAGTGDSPTRFSPSPFNPILLSTEGSLFGIGHNSVVKGPNLDLYYLVYHSLVGRGTIRGWPVRETRVDRLILNRDVPFAEGPTRTEREIPAPDFALWFDSSGDLTRLESARSNGVEPRVEDGFLRLGAGGAVVCPIELDGDFTAEHNLAIPDDAGVAGVFFCYRDPESRGAITIDRGAGKIRIEFAFDGKTETREYDLPKLFGEPISFASLRSLQIERTGNKFSFYVEDRLFAEIEFRAPGGAIGYFSESPDARFGFIGATRATEGRSAARLTELAPGFLSASYRTSERGVAPVEVVATGERRRVLPLSEGDSIKIELEALEDGVYAAGIRYLADSSCAATIGAESDAREVALERSFSGTVPGLATGVVKIGLRKGKNVLVARCLKGEFSLDGIELAATSPVEPIEDFAAVVDSPGYSDGTWSTEGGVLIATGKLFGKRCYGDSRWSDYRVEAELTLGEGDSKGGLLVRASELALGGPNNSPQLGADFALGYRVSFADESVVLEKLAHDRRVVASAPFDFKPNEPIRLRVDAIGAKISVAIDGREFISFVDPSPRFCGRPGVSARGGALKVEKFSVRPL